MLAGLAIFFNFEVSSNSTMLIKTGWQQIAFVVQEKGQTYDYHLINVGLTSSSLSNNQQLTFCLNSIFFPLFTPDNEPEFVLINTEPEPDPEDPSKLIYTEDPLIMHTPTGRLINYVEDEEHGVRLFWQPYLEDGEDVDPEKAEFLPLGFDEFYGKSAPGEKKESRLMSVITSLENKLKPLFERLDNWIEEKKQAREMNQKLIEKELEFIEAELCLEEALEDMENELKMKQKEEEKRAITEKGSDQASTEAGEDEADSDDEDDEDEGAPTSFGTVGQGETDKGDDKSRRSPFSSLSLALSSSTPVSMVSSIICHCVFISITSFFNSVQCTLVF